jgi:hypothetical protein
MDLEIISNFLIKQDFFYHLYKSLSPKDYRDILRHVQISKYNEYEPITTLLE